jgi:hypothetical protein
VLPGEVIEAFPFDQFRLEIYISLIAKLRPNAAASSHTASAPFQTLVTLEEIETGRG